jgi:hypothetical protein
VEIGDGCATVTGYKLPQPLVRQQTGKAGARFEARSQDIDPAVLVTVPRCGANFSVKEKDEASLRRECAAGFVNAFILRFAGA